MVLGRLARRPELLREVVFEMALRVEKDSGSTRLSAGPSGRTSHHSDHRLRLLNALAASRGLSPREVRFVEGLRTNSPRQRAWYEFLVARMRRWALAVAQEPPSAA